MTSNIHRLLLSLCAALSLVLVVLVYFHISISKRSVSPDPFSASIVTGSYRAIDATHGKLNFEIVNLTSHRDTANCIVVVALRHGSISSVSQLGNVALNSPSKGTITVFSGLEFGVPRNLAREVHPANISVSCF